jgi:hypothetical protein
MGSSGVFDKIECLQCGGWPMMNIEDCLCYGCQNAEARMARKIMFDHTRRQGSIDT